MADKREKPEITITGETGPGQIEIQVNHGEGKRRWFSNKAGTVLRKEVCAATMVSVVCQSG
jgi:hypothetical protein